MLIHSLRFVFQPINIHGGRTRPLYWSPAFAFLTLVTLIAFRWVTSLPPTNLSNSQPLEWAILVIFLGVPLALFAGGVPYVLVTLKELWGYAMMQCTLLSICFAFILALWANPNVAISPVWTFFQTAGMVATISLFLWPAVKYMGTPKVDHKALEELILLNAVNAVYRRGEISFEEAELVAPLRLSRYNPSVGLQSLSLKSRTSILREIEIERLLQSRRLKTSRRKGPRMNSQKR